MFVGAVVGAAVVGAIGVLDGGGSEPQYWQEEAPETENALPAHAVHTLAPSVSL